MSTIITRAHTKKSGNLFNDPYIYIYTYMIDIYGKLDKLKT